MDQKIPYHLFKDYIEMTRTKLKNNSEMAKYYKDLEKHTISMQNVLWEDIQKLSKEDLARIPISWLYDWTHVTANYHLQDQIAPLYEQHNLPKLSNQAFYNKYYNNK
jgi:hemerythrin superfamily protein